MNRMWKYEMMWMKTMFDLIDFDDVVTMKMMMNSKRNILIDVVENEEKTNDDDDSDGIGVMAIDNDDYGVDSDGYYSIDDNDDIHVVDHNRLENDGDDDRTKIFVDVHRVLMELMNHDSIFYRDENFHVLSMILYLDLSYVYDWNCLQISMNELSFDVFYLL